MIVKIAIEVSYDELEEYRREFFECNGVELPIEIAKKKQYFQPVYLKILNNLLVLIFL